MRLLVLISSCLLIILSSHLAQGQDIECFCSGVTSDCSEASMYWSTLRVPVRGDESGFSLTDRDQSPLSDSIKPVFKWDTYELSYRYNPGDSEVYYWALPDEFLGSKVGAYGGNLTVLQKAVFRGDPVQDSEVIMTGNGLTLHYGLGGGTRVSGKPERNRIMLQEEGWFVLNSGVPVPATREEFMKVLSNIEALLVRATISKEMEEAMIRKVMMDISVPQMTGGPLASGVEECQCPEGYTGLSCESCDTGFTRDQADGSSGSFGLCIPETSGPVWPPRVPQIYPKPREYPVPRANQNPQAYPTSPSDPIEVNISGPKVQTVRPGETVEFDCSAQPKFRTQDPMVFAWTKENGELPPGRCSDSGYGLLIITAVESQDSGTYVCTVTAGTFEVKKALELQVEDAAPAPPSVAISPPYHQVSEAGNVMFDCQANGSPTPEVSWARAGGFPLGRRARVQGSQLVLEFVQMEDEGEYVCTAANSEGMEEGRAQLYVEKEQDRNARPDTRPRPSYSEEPIPGINTGNSYPEDLYPRRYPEEDNIPPPPTYQPPVQYPPERNVEEAPHYPMPEQGYRNPNPAQPRYAPQEACPTVTVTIEPNEQTIPQGSGTKLTCIGSGSSAISWEKVGEDMSSPALSVTGSVVTVTSASVSDRGMYVCTATSSCGSGRASSILEVEPREIPTIEMYPSDLQTVTKGESVLFQCRYMSGIPTPIISWARSDGRPMPPNAELLSGGVLRMNSVTGAEAGSFRCRAENAAGRVESMATLRIQELPRIRMEPQGSVTSMVGSPLVIKCLVSGDPIPQISWKKMGTSLTQLSTNSANLEFAKLSKDDEGTYSCVASNAAGQMEDRLQVIVEENEEYLQQGNYPQDRQSPQSENRYPSEPENRYPPKQENRYPPESENRYPLEPENRYPPEPYNPYQTESPQNNPNEPSIPAVEHEVNTRVGMNVDLTCMNIGSMPVNTQTVWSRADGNPIAPRHKKADGILHIRGAKKSDEGLYLCQLIEPSGTVLFQLNANLVVQATRPPIRRPEEVGRSPFNWEKPPVIRPPPTYQDVPRSAGCPTRSWRCESGDCIPETARCDGYRDCRDGTDELDCPTISPPQDVNPPPTSPTLDVGGNSIRMSISGPTDRVVPTGETIQYLCQAVPTVELEDPLTLLWVKENEDLPPGRCNDDGEGTLQISRVQPVDSGVYICVATAGTFINTAKATLAVGAVVDNQEPPQKGYQQPSRPRPQPDRRYQYPSGPRQDAFDSSHGPSRDSGDYPDLGDDDYGDDDYDDYDYSRSPISYSSADYGRMGGSNESPDQQYPSSYDQMGQPIQPCAVHEFECADLSQCVPNSQRCDGEFDCMDGSDEGSCGG